MKLHRFHLRDYITIFALLIPAIISIKSVFEGGMAFWFDPARDFLLAVENLKKPTLIGSPTGIPGLFYGPYWIWLISGALLINRNPLVVTIIILTIPYLIFFPFILYLLRAVIGKNSWIILWLLFFNGFQDYIVSLWNPHLAPLLFLILIYLVINVSFEINPAGFKRLFFSGFVAGLIVNFHFSFGIGVFTGTCLFLFISYLINQLKNLNRISIFVKDSLLLFFSFTAGLLFSFLPFLIFESRHGFNQSKALLETFMNAVLNSTPVTGLVGLSHNQIIYSALTRVFKLLAFTIPTNYILLLAFIVLFLLFFGLYYTKIQLSQSEINLIILLILVWLSVLFIYLSSTNPVWDYHFIGFEIIYLLLIGVFVNKINFTKVILALWVGYLTINNIKPALFPKEFNPYTLSSLKTKEYIVDTVYKDTNKNKFTVFVYSPAIYTYDYDYVFSWYGKDKYGYVPDREINNNNVYLIIPKTDPAVLEDFIHYKTPDNSYKTEKQWNIDDGTTIIKRAKIARSNRRLF